MRWQASAQASVGLALGILSLVTIGFTAVSAVSNHTTAYNYIVLNLFLAWIPLGLSVWLLRILRHHAWTSWPALGVSALWLGFLPNSFYVLSDFIHINEMPRADAMFDVAMFGSLAISGLLLGYLSLCMVHRQLVARRVRYSNLLVGVVLLLSSFAIYIGRDLRWNTWDVIINPASLLFDVSDRLLNVQTHPQMVSTTVGFFLLLGSTYLVVWRMVRVLEGNK